MVFNPVKADIDALRTALEVIVGDDLDLLLHETSAEDDGVGAAQAAIADDPLLVIVSGGDGTVRIVADTVAGSGIPLGIVAAGTGNLLARNLALPLSPIREAVRVAVEGDDSTIDLADLTATHADGSVVTYPFAVMAGVGLDAATMSATDDDLKKRIGWVAYIGGLFKALQAVKHFEGKGTFDGDDVREFEANTVLIGNAGMLQANVHVLPDAQLDDGLLDVAFVNPEGPLEWMQVMNEVASNSDPIQRELRKKNILPDRKKIDQMGFRQTSRVTLEFEQAVHLQIDGDTVGEVVRLECRVRPDALTVRVRQA